jgi:hypothetical protein
MKAKAIGQTVSEYLFIVAGALVLVVIVAYIVKKQVGQTGG